MTTPNVTEVTGTYSANLARLRAVRAIVADMRMVLSGMALGDARTVPCAPIRISFGVGPRGVLRASEVHRRLADAGISVDRIDWTRRCMYVTEEVTA